MTNVSGSTTFARFVLMIYASLAVSIARAATFTVDTTEDLVDDDVTDGICQTAHGNCSLRGAIMQANQSGADYAYIDVPAGIYSLSPENGDLFIYPGPVVVLLGATAASTIIERNAPGGGIYVREGASANISGVTIRGGAMEAGGNGVNVAGSLAITDSVVENNRGIGIANWGALSATRVIVRSNVYGGIKNDTGTASIDDCIIESNSSDWGAGIYNSGVMDLLRSTVRSNVSANSGGGLWASGYTTIRDSAIYGNRGSDGGGIAVGWDWPEAYLYIVNSTISENSAVRNGGGIYSGPARGKTFVYNTTIVHNKANANLQSGGVGGGIYAMGHSDFYNNFPRFALINTVMSRNVAGFDTSNDCVGAFEAYGRNFVGDPTSPNCRTTNARLSRVTSSSIGPLRDNGGPTLTNALLPGSEAIDSALYNLGCVDWTGAQLATDQRGAPRPASIRYCDAGSFEYGVSPPDDGQQ